MKNKPPHPLVLIKWLDHHSSEGWLKKDEMKHHLNLVTVLSVGFLIDENDDVIVLAMDISDEFFGACMTIGKNDIIKKVRLNSLFKKGV